MVCMFAHMSHFCVMCRVTSRRVSRDRCGYLFVCSLRVDVDAWWWWIFQVVVVVKRRFMQTHVCDESVCLFSLGFQYHVRIFRSHELRTNRVVYLCLPKNEDRGVRSNLRPSPDGYNFKAGVNWKSQNWRRMCGYFVELGFEVVIKVDRRALCVARNDSSGYYSSSYKCYGNKNIVAWHS